MYRYGDMSKTTSFIREFLQALPGPFPMQFWGKTWGRSYEHSTFRSCKGNINLLVDDSIGCIRIKQTAKVCLWRRRGEEGEEEGVKGGKGGRSHNKAVELILMQATQPYQQQYRSQSQLLIHLRAG